MLRTLLIYQQEESQGIISVSVMWGVKSVSYINMETLAQVSSMFRDWRDCNALGVTGTGTLQSFRFSGHKSDCGALSLSLSLGQWETEIRTATTWHMKWWQDQVRANRNTQPHTDSLPHHHTHHNHETEKGNYYISTSNNDNTVQHYNIVVEHLMFQLTHWLPAINTYLSQSFSVREVCQEYLHHLRQSGAFPLCWMN